MNFPLLKFIVILLFLILGSSFYLMTKPKTEAPPVPTQVEISGRQKVRYPQDYTIVMIGDSMTETLGNSDEIKKFLGQYYQGKTFEVLNYGFGATNILTVVDRINKNTEHERKFRPISEIDYDLVLLESFGQNPLSHLSLEEGLKVQSQELERIVKLLKDTNPEGKIVFVASISPNKKTFAQTSVDLSPEKRSEWAEERIAYIKNHIEYAQTHNIPIINVFEKSLLENGDGNPDYINTDDYIHPSPTGIIFISQTIADFLFQNKIL